jgi:3-methylcrotonyl-CoA carboxylase alpha subunit
MFKKILIANRGEIACRVAATARRLGIRTVAVYSEADRTARHVALCDDGVLIGAAAARDSYLNYRVIIEAALASGAEAIHPGYGFLSENGDFAEACADAGLVFIGPPPSAMRSMGSKSAAKTLMAVAGVPLVPGYHGANQDADFLQREGDRIGYPLLLKASAGGGGKGMRVVEGPGDFKPALASCRREALNAFGDEQVLLEKYLIRPRHIEIQVFADMHGHCIHLYERDCSVQRRHQKVLEEAPAPGMQPERRAAMGRAAIAAAKAVGYVGAGTVEFIVDPDGTFYFMEMNTRLQVEHPVTEMITGLDLVEWQLRVADGQPLPLTQEQLALRGHALEARIYAENPEHGFLPSTGMLRHLRMPDALAFAVGADGGDGGDDADGTNRRPAAVRIDAGVREGDLITPFYDPLLAKLIVWGEDRPQALSRMQQALAQWQVAGPATNLAFLQRLVASPAFCAAELDTGLIERHQALLLPPPGRPPFQALVLATVAQMAGESGTNRAQAGNDLPWSDASGWCLGRRRQRNLIFFDEHARHEVQVQYLADGWRIAHDGRSATVRLLGRDGPALVLAVAEARGPGSAETILRASVAADGDMLHIFVAASHHALTYLDPMAHAGLAEAGDGRLTAPMPGKIVAVLVASGQQVKSGQPLLIMEAMKMEHTISAPGAGTVDEILYAVGEQVADGAPLLTFH